MPQNVFGVRARLADGYLACEISNLLARSSGQNHHFIAICNDEQIINAVHRHADAVGVN